MTIIEYMRLRVAESSRIKSGEKFSGSRLKKWVSEMRKWEASTPELADHHKGHADNPAPYDQARDEIKKGASA